VNRHTTLGARRYAYAPADEFHVMDDGEVGVPGLAQWLSMTLRRVFALQ